MTRARQSLMGSIAYSDTPYDAANGADALLILTDWEEFGALDLPRIKNALRYPIVIDGRNLYSRETMQKHGLLYLSIGRPEVELEAKSASAFKLSQRG